MTAPKAKRRVRCEDCEELVPPDEINRETWNDEGPDGERIEITMLICDDCRDAASEADYGTFGDREDQISYDSAMYRDMVGDK